MRISDWSSDVCSSDILPTRRDEAWRYSDIEALARLWPLPAPESIIVPAGGDFKRAIVKDAGEIRQVELVLGKGAVASLHVLNIGGAYGRIRWEERRVGKECVGPCRSRVSQYH